KLAEGDQVVSMAVIRHFEATPEERVAYLRRRRAVAGAGAMDESDAEIEAEEAGVADIALPEGRYAEMSAAEDLILTITERGLGKLSSSHDYPVRGRGGQGVAAIDRAMRGGLLVASFPVVEDDQIMLVTDRGQSIRCPISGISFRSRSAGGVKVFNTAGDERVVSVAYIAEQGEE
ncbi:MAG: DNA gyrase C-terminal beta-propeller domain-containing protein, partial [Myxococcota bacterium]